MKSKYNFVGKTGFARDAHTLRFYAVSRYEEPHKIGKLAENRRFFDKHQGRCSPSLFDGREISNGD